MNVYLDTNIYLHFEPIDKIDFCSELQAERVTIVVPRVVLKELDKHKTEHRSNKMRDRAIGALALLEHHITSGNEIREGVTLELEARLPKTEVVEDELEDRWVDDSLIASALLRIQNDESIDTMIVSDDTGLRLAALARGIPSKNLDDKYRVVSDATEEEKELQKLRKQVQRLENALPKIHVEFVETRKDRIEVFIPAPNAIDEDQIQSELKRVADKFPLHPLPSAGEDAEGRLDNIARTLTPMQYGPNSISEGEITRYNSERDEYLAEYEEYLREKHELVNLRNLTVRFEVVIVNTGYVPADEIDILLKFPDGFELYQDEGYDDEPEAPVPPQPPRTLSQMMNLGIFSASLSNYVSPGLPDIGPDPTFTLRKTNSYEFTDHIERVKHGMMKFVEKLVLVFNSYDSADSFHADYTVSVANLPEHIEGQLHFVVLKEEVDSE